MAQSSVSTRKRWRDEIKDIVCGASGGFLFGIPLLYTMEVWWIGSYTEPPLMLTVLAVTFVVVFFLNRTDGFRQVSPDSPLQAMMDSVEAIAIGIFCVTVVLILLQEITPQTSLNEIVGKIILEGMPFTIGVALARSMLTGVRNQAGKGDEAAQGNSESTEFDRSSSDSGSQAAGSQAADQNTKQTEDDRYNATLADIGATLVGTIIIAFNVAPTDEVPMLTAAITPPWLIAIVLASICISYGIVFAAGFTTQEHRLQQQGIFQKPIVETVVTYLVSLFAAAMMLWFFHRLGVSDPWTVWLKQTLVLGLPAAVGGAAGRLAV